MILFITGIIAAAVGIGGAVLIFLSMTKMNKAEPRGPYAAVRDIYKHDESLDVEIISLDDIGPEKEVPIEEWAEEKEAMYKQDISEAFPKETIEAIENAKDEEYPPLELQLDAGHPYPIIDILLSEELQMWTQQCCQQYEVPYPLVLGLMDSESSFRKDIGTEKVLGGSEGGARYYGYMQLSSGNCKNATEAGIDPHSETGNIEWGVRYLKSCYHEDWQQAVASYKGTSNKEAKTVLNVMKKTAQYEQMLEEAYGNTD